MRVANEFQLETQDGLVAVLDAALIGAEAAADFLSFQVPPGSAPIYAHEGALLVDPMECLDPKMHAEVQRVGDCEIESGYISILDGRLLPVEASDHPGVLFNRFPFRHLVVWLEEMPFQQEASWSPWTRILGVGGEARLVLSGPAATEVHRLEKRLAQALQSKGKSRQRQLAELRAEILELDRQGVRDQRLDRIRALVKPKEKTGRTPSRATQRAKNDQRRILQQAKDTFLSAGLAKASEDRRRLYLKSAELFERAAELGEIPRAYRDHASKARRFAQNGA